MPSPYLSKSDFKACFECGTKLFYRKKEYPTTLDENEYLRFLADGGFMVESIAKAQHPDGIDLVAERDPQAAFSKTKKLIAANPDVVIYEAAVLWNNCYARIDILRREGNTLHLIEVKSSSIDASDDESPFVSTRGVNKGLVSTKWKPYLLDVAFQVRVLRHAFPKFKIRPWLCLVNKVHRVTANETLGRFRLIHDDTNPKARPEVVYEGDPALLKGTGFLSTREVSAEVELLMPEVESRAIILAALLDGKGKVSRVQEYIPDFYKNCRTCEYRFRKEKAPKYHGFAECWKKMADVEPHILDMYRVGQIGSGRFQDPVPGLVARGKGSLLDLREDQLGTEGTLRDRRHLQWMQSRAGGKEYLSAALRQELRAHKTKPGWPLHFVDFEACSIALPHHAGLRPYEQVAFQWSCHTLSKEGKYVHDEWLNTDGIFPNFKFARTLRNCIGDEGTVYVWSPYEQSTLKRVLTQIEEWMQQDPKEALRVAGLRSLNQLKELADWIDLLLGPEDDKGKRPLSPRICDLHKLVLEHYFHPDMLGKTSIKSVLPAVWQHSRKLQTHPWFAKYLPLSDQGGQPLNPYKTLPPLPLGEGDESEDSVTEGTGAIRVPSC